MSMSFKQAAEKFVEDLVQAEVQKLLPMAAKLAGDAFGPFAGNILASALQLPAVQAKIAEIEIKAADFVIEEIAKGFGELRDLILEHVHGQMGALIHALFEKTPPITLALDAEDVKNLAVLSSAGKLKAAVAAGLSMAGLQVQP